MNAENFAELVRKKNLQLRAEELKLLANGTTVAGSGTLRIEGEKITLRFFPTATQTLPPLESGAYLREQFWEIEGLIEGVLPFICDAVPPGGSRSNFRNTIKASESADLTLSYVDFPAFGPEAFTSKELARHLGKQKTATNASLEIPDSGDDYFEASLADYPELLRNSITTVTTHNDFFGESKSQLWDTFIDQIDGFRFALIRNEADLSVRMESGTGAGSLEPLVARRKFHALLTAIGITHGKHAWPFHELHMREGKKLFERVTTPKETGRISYRPFDEALTQILPPDDVKHHCGSAVRLLAKFFDVHEELGKEISELAFLFREAHGRGTNHDIATLASCVLFEALVNLLFKHYVASGSATGGKPLSEFEKSKLQLLEFISTLPEMSEITRGRLKGRIEFTDEIRVEEKFRRLCEHFNLSWDSDLAECAAGWKKLRSASAHGGGFLEFDPAKLEARALIAGAFYLLILKAAGYSGPLVLSDCHVKRHKRI